MANVEAAKNLKRPGNLLELHTYVSYMKDKSGISGWQEQQHLLEVRFVNYLPVLSTPRSKTNIFCNSHCEFFIHFFCNIAIIIAQLELVCSTLLQQQNHCETWVISGCVTTKLWDKL